MESARRRQTENRIQTRRCINSSGSIWFPFPALLSISASGGASRSGKHISGDCLGSLSLGICVCRSDLARHRPQVESLAASKPNLSRSVLVRCRIHGHHDYPLGLVAALTVALPPKSFFPQAHCKRTLLTLYAGTRSSLGGKGGQNGSQTRRDLSLPRHAVRL
jgi:hypothetical protein